MPNRESLAALSVSSFNLEVSALKGAGLSVRSRSRPVSNVGKFRSGMRYWFSKEPLPELGSSPPGHFKAFIQPAHLWEVLYIVPKHSDDNAHECAQINVFEKVLGKVNTGQTYNKRQQKA